MKPEKYFSEERGTLPYDLPEAKEAGLGRASRKVKFARERERKRSRASWNSKDVRACDELALRLRINLRQQCLIDEHIGEVKH